jgi:putative transcriptional regulator
METLELDNNQPIPLFLKRKLTMGKMFEKLHKSLSDAIEYERGNITLRTKQIVIPEAPKSYDAATIKKMRAGLGMSQRDFALWLNVSLNTVKAWEQDVRNPSHSALRLLEVFEKGSQKGFSYIMEIFGLSQERSVQQAKYVKRPAYIKKSVQKK